MKNTLIIIIAIALIFSCQSKSKEIDNYIETKTSFFDLRNGDLLTNSWIREPENLEMIHETLKKYCYMDLLTEFYHDENTIILKDIYIKKNIVDLVDSLVLTYQKPAIESKYYREFWDRRIKEMNDSIVFIILQDIQRYKISKVGPPYSEQLVNDTLFDLLEIEFHHDTITNDIAIKNFDKLIKYGFHQSAYNLLNERYEYYDIDWDKEELIKKLTKTDKYENAWMIDNTK